MEPEFSFPIQKNPPLSLSWARRIQSTNTHPISLKTMQLFLPSTYIGLKVFRRTFQPEFCKHFCFLLCLLHTGLLLDSNWFGQPNDIWWGARSTDFMIMMLPWTSSHFLHFMFRYSHHTPSNCILLSPSKIRIPITQSRVYKYIIQTEASLSLKGKGKDISVRGRGGR
jgi:hypothetical protein